MIKRNNIADTYSVCIVVEHHQVAVADVETWQMVTSVLGIKYVLVDHVGCSSCFRRVSSEEQGRTQYTVSGFSSKIYSLQWVFEKAEERLALQQTFIVFLVWQLLHLL